MGGGRSVTRERAGFALLVNLKAGGRHTRFLFPQQSQNSLCRRVRRCALRRPQTLHRRAKGGTLGGCSIFVRQ